MPPPVIQKIVRDDFGAMRKCYEEGLGRDPKLAGRVVTLFVIDRDGTVSVAMDYRDARPHSSGESKALQDAPRFPDAKVTECVVARFKALKFPEPDGGIVTVVYPVVFAPGDD